MSTLNELTGILHQIVAQNEQVIAQNKQALEVAGRVLSLVEQETQLDCWVTGSEAEKLLRGMASDRTLREMAGDNRLVYGQHYIQMNRVFKFNPKAVKEYFETPAELRVA